MAIGYKNLILIDNSKSIGEANFLLSKETAKYICKNMAGEDECRVAVFGEDTEYIDDYSHDVKKLSADIDALELKDRDTYITDNLVKILEEWKEQDVACRNIILFTDGKENESVLHANEELYYMLTDLSYPVYIVQCVETRNDTAMKNLSAIATMSKGKLLLTEFEGSDGGSEKIMGDSILNEINMVRNRVEEGTAEIEEVSAEEGTKDMAAGDQEAMFIENDQEESHEDAVADSINTVYELKDSYGVNETSPVIVNSKDTGGIGFSVVFPLIGVIFAALFALVIYFITHRNDRLKRRDRKALKKIGCSPSLTDRIEGKIAEDAEDVDCTTMRLRYDEGATRLLSSEEDAYNIVLEDCTDPTRIYRAGGSSNLIVGRSRGLCDIVIDHDDSISGRHCELSVVDGNWYVKDLKSSNGTRVNSQKVFQELMIKNGDIIKLGQTALQVGI